MKTEEAKAVYAGAGCIINLLRLLVTLPLWYILVYQLLAATSQPTWVWVLYWIYTPLLFLFAILGELFDKARKIL